MPNEASSSRIAGIGRLLARTVRSAIPRWAIALVLGAVTLSHATEAPSLTEQQRLRERVLDARAALVTLRGHAITEVPPNEGSGNSSRLAQWMNWPNWGNWNNWPNWSNWLNWFNR